jgi:hypothetical protein
MIAMAAAALWLRERLTMQTGGRWRARRCSEAG